MKSTLIILLLLVLGSPLTFAEQKSDYPKRPITIICPWSAGGGTDAVARIVAQELQNALGQPVNVVNRTGGGGAVGHTAIAEAKPDGYTLGLITTELPMMHWTGMTDLTYKQFNALGLINVDSPTVFVTTDSGIDSLPELIEFMRDNAGDVLASGASVGGIYHISFVGALPKMGIDVNAARWIPSKGAAPALQDLVAGGIHVAMASLPEAASLMDAGKVKPLAIFSEERHPDFPDVPTLIEEGYDWTGIVWRGVAVPKDTPVEIVKILETELEKIAKGSVFLNFMKEKGYGVTWKNSEEFNVFLKQKDEESGKVMKAAGIAK
jgi:tripartite-type tricarboxylate transporter receptor subunit TctC